MPAPAGPQPLVMIDSPGSALEDRLSREVESLGYRVRRVEEHSPPLKDAVAWVRDRSHVRSDSGGDWDSRSRDTVPTIWLGQGPVRAEPADAAAPTPQTVIPTPVDWGALRSAVTGAVRMGLRFRGERDLLRSIERQGGPRLAWYPDAPSVDVLRTVGGRTAATLIHGEMGTGKRTLARALHTLGGGRHVVTVRGWRRGADAPDADMLSIVRRWQDAAGGTLLIDEVADLREDDQWALTGLLEAQDARDDSLESEVRLICTSSVDPETAVEEGDLREDLFYRLVFVCGLDPLRDRRAEIPPLARHFVRDANRRHGLRVEGLSAEATEALRNARWPGNLTQVRSSVRRACLLAESGRLQVHHLPPSVRKDGTGPPEKIAISVGTTAAEAERRLILATLERTGFNKAEAARQLQLDVKTIRNKLRAYGIG